MDTVVVPSLARNRSTSQFHAPDRKDLRCGVSHRACEDFPHWAGEDAECQVELAPTYGGTSSVKLRYRLLGPSTAPVIVVQGGISADRVVCELPGDAAVDVKPWWPQVVGPGRAIDTKRVRVLCLEWLTPVDYIAPGHTENSLQPPKAVTTADQADALAALLHNLGIHQLAAFVGSSYGGMVGLAFAARHPTLLGRLVAISAAHRPHPYSTALWSVQRRIVKLGQSCGATSEALALSRQLAMTTFRTPTEFIERFDNVGVETNDGFRFGVEAYLDVVGEKFVARFDAERFLALSESIDLHNVDPTFITIPTTLVAVTSDRLIFVDEIRRLTCALGSSSEIYEIDSIYGHDAFLKEDEKISSILRKALKFELTTTTILEYLL